MNIYQLSRAFWNFSFENPEKIKPNHIAVYFFAIEHCNRLGWKEKFGFPTSMVLDAIGVKSYSVYKKTLDELVDFGFIEMVEVSRNQFSSNIIALKESYNATVEPLTKAIMTHITKQDESTSESDCIIDIPITILPITNNNNDAIVIKHNSYAKQAMEQTTWVETIEMQKVIMSGKIEVSLKHYNLHLIAQSESKTSLKDYKSHFVNWMNKRNEKKAQEAKNNSKPSLGI